MKPTLCKSFASPITPFRPKVIPLFATPITSRLRRVPSLHQDLPARPRFHPYAKRPPQGLRTSRDGNSASMPTSHTSDESPPSPLTPTPLPDDEESEGSADTTERQAKVILEEQPVGFTLAGSGWKPALIRSLRTHGKEVIHKYLNVGLKLSDQDSESLQKARDELLQEFPEFRNHENFWGIDAVLRDQLKSMKDTKNARARKNKTDARTVEGDD